MKLLVPIDDRVFAEVILRFLKQQNWPDDCQIRIAHVIGPIESAFVWPNKVLVEEATNLTDSTAAHFRLVFPQATVSSVVLQGGIADAILKEAESWKADLIAMGSHSRSNLARVFMGSVSSTIAKMANIPVIVLRPPIKGTDEELNQEIQPIWLEEMTPEHERYFLEHVTEHPFQIDGSDWSHLIQMRLEHEYYHQSEQKECSCPDLLTKLHSVGTPLREEREAAWRAMQYWFLKGPNQYKPQMEGKDNIPTHALKVLSQVDSNAHIKAAEKEWLKSRIKVWAPGNAPYWIADRGEANEGGAQVAAGTPIINPAELSKEVTTNVAATEEE